MQIPCNRLDSSRFLFVTQTPGSLVHLARLTLIPIVISMSLRSLLDWSDTREDSWKLQHYHSKDVVASPLSRSIINQLHLRILLSL